METEADLPRANVRRIVKAKIEALKGVNGVDIHIQREALSALSESARVFIHLLSATANDICLENKRQTIQVDDVIKALEDLEFVDLISDLESSIEEHRNDLQERSKKRSESMKKRKALMDAEKLAAQVNEEEQPKQEGTAVDVHMGEAAAEEVKNPTEEAQ